MQTEATEGEDTLTDWIKDKIVGNLKITELMPRTATWPEWAQQAAAEGRLFRECMDRISVQRRALCEARGYLQARGAAQSLIDTIDTALDPAPDSQEKDDG